jgi:regulator of cell morphogenesis and NO signaling
MQITKDSNIGELVAQDYRVASVFKNHGIDFCCQGNRSIEDACSKKNIDSETVVSQLVNATQSSGGESIDYKSWPLDLLADYIEKKHHRYVETRITEIKPFLNKIVKVHGHNHPELHEIEEKFLASAGELTMHMKKEELVLFPFIRKMVQAQQSGQKIEPAHFGTVENPIANMHHEHDTEGERFRQISALSNNYTPPEDACNTYRVTFSMLQEFENDLHLHIHLENNILFPKAIELEKTLAN